MDVDELWNKDYVNKKHMEQFSKALEADDFDAFHITSKNDWAPVKEKVQKSGKRKRDIGVGLGYRILRWPFFVFICLWVSILAVIYAFVRFYVALYENTFTWRGKRQELRKKLRSAETYEEWVKAAEALDRHLGFESWKSDPEFGFYDYRTIAKLVGSMHMLRREGRVDELATVLQTCVKHNFAGTQGRAMYSQCYYGTKDIVDKWNDELVESLGYLSQSNELPMPTKRLLFKQFAKNFGKTALCLSGGATFTYRHFGVVKALLEADLLPNIVSGTSGGGLVAALVATRTNAELKELLVPELADKITACHEKFPTWAKRMYKTGARFDARDWAERCCWFTRGSMTFREAYEKTGKILNISTVPADPHSPVILCNYITSPDAVIWSTLLASAAVPGILNPVMLMMKKKTGDIAPYSFGNKWKDGSLRTDIPVQSLRMYFNVNFTIVSQVNPHISLFVYAPRGTVGRPVSHRKGKGWRGGFLGSTVEDLVKLEIRKWLKLMRHMDLTPRILDQDWSSVWLQRFDGSVTLWPKIQLKDFYYILSDPTREKLASMMRGGEMCAYPKLVMIRHQMNIERAIQHGRRLTSRDRRAVACLADDEAIYHSSSSMDFTNKNWVNPETEPSDDYDSD
ncbi:hypothetical protein TRVA0_006S01156 [Trichomonascus vanleenenianus]|uniref:patatin-like phospholipase domain-containing protein n=1 Tax=Trichomonascus vanleenenianus TaxID=2268995 RepID=UPI003ECB8313